MRKIIPNLGEERVIRNFLLFPKVLKTSNCSHCELRWLEITKVRQTLRCDAFNRYYWEDLRWEN